MKVAFYAPLKPPSHPVPSGDRLIARLLLEALARGGHQPELVSTFRSYEGRGDAARQRRLAEVGRRLGDRVARRLARREKGARPRCWLTYHLYHKAPDWVGPAVCTRLDIPYVVVEASDAPGQAGGPWDEGLRACRRALAGAAAVVAINPDDLDGVRPHLRPGAGLEYIPAFIDASTLLAMDRGDAARRRSAEALGLGPGGPLIACVAMMRAGNKLRSYRVLAEALVGLDLDLDAVPWRLAIAGDGPVRAEVEAAFGPIRHRVAFLGRLDPPAVHRLLTAADLFVWPGVREPLGLVYLEAQAAGVPVIGCAARGAPSLVADGRTGLLVPPGEPGPLREALRTLVADPARRRRLGSAGRERVRGRHDIAVAAPALARLVDRVIEASAR